MTDALDAMKQLAQEIEAEKKKVKMTGEQAFDYLILQAQYGYEGYCKPHSINMVKVEGKEVEVKLHRVGHNTSHEFYIGLLSDGRLIVRSYCVNSLEDVAELGVPDVGINTTVQGTAQEVNFPSYLGHY